MNDQQPASDAKDHRKEWVRNPHDDSLEVDIADRPEPHAKRLHDDFLEAHSTEYPHKPELHARCLRGDSFEAHSAEYPHRPELREKCLHAKGQHCVDPRDERSTFFSCWSCDAYLLPTCVSTYLMLRRRARGGGTLDKIPESLGGLSRLCPYDN